MTDCMGNNCPNRATCVREYDQSCPYVQRLVIRYGPRDSWGLSEDERIHGLNPDDADWERGCITTTKP